MSAWLHEERHVRQMTDEEKRGMAALAFGRLRTLAGERGWILKATLDADCWTVGIHCQEWSIVESGETMYEVLVEVADRMHKGGIV